MATLGDSFSRTFQYLRLSVTDVCNFKCVYCLPHGYQKPSLCEAPLSFSEIRNLIGAFTELGIEKVRLTGGEPTVREDIVDLVGAIARTPGIRTVALTTNGYRLKKLARPLFDAGLSALNVSVDSLDPDRFEEITGRRQLSEVLDGIEAARVAGIRKIKLNSVLLKDITDRDFDRFMSYVRDSDASVRFIELMETKDNGAFFRKHHLTAGAIQFKLSQGGWKMAERHPTDGPAIEYSHPDFSGKMGVIAPYSKEFCRSCNRLRVTSMGKLRLCLFGEADYSIRPLLADSRKKEDLIAAIRNLIGEKPQSHLLKQGIYGNTSNLAAIGG